MKRLPPVEIIAPPARWSQTLLDKNDKCPRSAYLHEKHRGGQVGHQLDRGSLFHLFAAKATLLLMEHATPGTPAVLGELRGEIDWEARRFRAKPRSVEVLPSGRRRPAAPVKAAVDVVKQLLQECYAENPGLVVPLSERDALREMAYHWAAYPVIDPGKVVAVERKFVCDLPNGHRISGIIDVAEIDGGVLRIRDYKTQWDVPTAGEYANTFQGRFYAVLAMYGQPVTEIFCSECAGTGLTEGGPPPLATVAELKAHQANPICRACDGHGYFEHLEPCIASHLHYADPGEIYPRRLFDDGMPVRNLPMTALQVADVRDDLAQQCDTLAEQFATGSFPAIDGNHCQRCPARSECPLPKVLRPFSGMVNEPEEAAEAASWVEMMDARLRATRKELKEFVRHHGPVRFGRDRVLEFEVREKWSPVKWDAVEADLEAAAKYGQPFELSKHRRPQQSNNFVVRVLSPAELDAEKEGRRAEA